MILDDDVKRRTAGVYNAAADFCDDPALSFWDRFGSRTVERLALRAGATVLDVCCGAGASALAAAQRVGPEGKVHALDLAERLVDSGRRKAARLGLGNVTFQVADMERTGFPGVRNLLPSRHAGGHP
jgi:ubiquinone/menaquinone biosynthesis C-methylase UbiE